jgi:hypothetical protein
MNEIVIKFQAPVTGIKLIASDDIKEHYKSRGKNVPFQWVGCPYVKIAGISYAVIPFEGVEYPSLSTVMQNE